MLTDAGLQLYAWRRKEMVTEDVGSVLHYNEERTQPKTVNISTLSCNLSVFTRVRLLVLWVLETVGVAGIVSGSSFTGRPAFAVNVICKRELVKLYVNEHSWLLLSLRIGKVFRWRGQRTLRTLGSMYY